MLCNLCPRKCNIDRSGGNVGFCGETNELRVARIAPHYFEEPPISAVRGSGTVFFSGCSLRCVYCQNKDISRPNGVGKKMSAEELRKKIIELLALGVHNLNLVTPTHFAHLLAPLLASMKARGELTVPVVYNSSGYERAETLKMFDGIVDIYMPDFKYASAELALRYSSAPDYPTVALDALREMLRQRGRPIYSENEPDVLKSGVIVRHLVLPSHRADSISALELLANELGTSGFLLSLMSQYTPDFALDSPHKNLHRRITSFEYESVCQKALELGFSGFTQSKNSALSDFTPKFAQE